MKSIGGEMLYTPGDIVYSSTKIINQALPDLSTLKLSHILKKNKSFLYDWKTKKY